MISKNKANIKQATLATFLLLSICNLCYASDKKPLPMVSLTDYLRTMSAKLDCYFTLEWNQVKDGYSFVGYEIPDDPSVDSVKALIEKFQRDTPEIEAVQDAENPVVVHLRTHAMKNVKDQILDHKTTVHFTGTIRLLPNEIARHTNGGLSFAKTLSVPVITPDDFETLVDVKAKNRLIRSILSDYMPLSRYSSLLWLAMNIGDSHANFMQVFYNGLVTSKPYSGDPKDKAKVYPFSDGRNAYFLNPLSTKLTAEATKFITDGFQSNKTLNVRWSMYYLGKQKVESAIPLLLEHLDYRYTTVPVLAEAYPAVHALLDMGKLSTSPVQQQMTTETNPLRLQLLCAVLLGVHGAYDGRRLTAETAAKLPEAQEKRIMDALLLAEEQLIAVPPPVDNVSSPHPVPLAP